MALYFLPDDLDVEDLEGDGRDEAWQLIFPVLNFAHVQVEFAHLHEDGEECEGTRVEGHPLVLSPCKDRESGALGHGPAFVWIGGEGTFFPDYNDALREAEARLARLLHAKDEIDALEALVNGPQPDPGPGA